MYRLGSSTKFVTSTDPQNRAKLLRPWHGDLSADEPQQAAFDHLTLQTKNQLEVQQKFSTKMKLHHHHQPKRPRPCNLGLRDNPKQLRMQSAANATDTAAGQISAFEHVTKTCQVHNGCGNHNGSGAQRRGRNHEHAVTTLAT